MDRKDSIYGKNLHELDLAGVAELCAKRCRQSFRRARAIGYGACAARGMGSARHRPPAGDGKKEAEASLKKRMLEFLSGVPAWMLTGL